MADTPTTRLGLSKPDTTEFVNVQQDLADNYDKIDAAVGTMWVNDGVVPPTSDLFDGKIVKEIGSGRSFTARTNGSGGYNLIPDKDNGGIGLGFAAGVGLGSIPGGTIDKLRIVTGTLNPRVSDANGRVQFTTGFTQCLLYAHGFCDDPISTFAAGGTWYRSAGSINDPAIQMYHRAGGFLGAGVSFSFSYIAIGY